MFVAVLVEMLLLHPFRQTEYTDAKYLDIAESTFAKLHLAKPSKYKQTDGKYRLYAYFSV